MKTLSELTARKRCAMYNELSHMTPYYLTPDLRRPLDLEGEILFHKRNVYLLALTFDHILICTDNIAGFHTIRIRGYFVESHHLRLASQTGGCWHHRFLWVGLGSRN